MRPKTRSEECSSRGSTRREDEDDNDNNINNNNKDKDGIPCSIVVVVSRPWDDMVGKR